MGKTRTSKPKFKHSVNRRRINRKNKNVGHFTQLGSIIKNAWEEKSTLRKNMKNMGLAFDPNEVVKIPKPKESIKKLLSSNTDLPCDDEQSLEPVNSKTQVIEELETFANAPREKRFALPQNQVIFLTYLLDKYGENYKAMARDRKNIWQETWKQIKAKVQLFKKVPHQWEEYLQHREELEKSGEVS